MVAVVIASSSMSPLVVMKMAPRVGLYRQIVTT
jgi:hypothetical protein